jgi:hypothetical protein
MGYYQHPFALNRPVRAGRFEREIDARTCYTGLQRVKRRKGSFGNVRIKVGVYAKSLFQ